MADRPVRLVSSADLGRLIEELLGACGCPADSAAAAAEVFVEAELRGIGVQGIDYLQYMLRALRNGTMDPQGRPRIVREGPATALVDGARGPGQPAALLAAAVAARKASEAGAAAIGVTNGTDIYMIGYYAEKIAHAGHVGMVCTSGAPLVHPYGGAERMLSTNPIAFAIPSDGPHPVLFDMATSAQSNARVRQASYHGEQMPLGSGVGPDGLPTTDAATIRKGAISPLAGHKGYGLGLCVALLSGPLTGSDVGRALEGWIFDGPAGAMGHLFVAIDPAAFGDAHAFRAAVGAYLAEIKGSRRAPGVEAIRIPGERAFAERARRLEEGVTILEATWAIIAEHAAALGVSMPA